MSSKRRRSVKLWPWWLVVLADLAAVGAVIGVFFLFHHVIPLEGGAPVRQIVNISPVTPAPVPTPEPTIAPAVSASIVPTPGATPALTPSPTLLPGDFSASFPNYDTGAAYPDRKSHQSETARVTIEKVAQDGVTYYVADIYIRNISNFRTAFAEGKYGRSMTETVPKMAERNDAIIAISGDYYGAHENGVVIRNGYLYRSSPLEDVCVIYQDGVMETYTKYEFNIESAIARGAYQAWCFGPSLLEDGQAVNLDSHSLARTNPRCAIGYYEPGHYVFVVADGRQKGYSDGLTLTQLSIVMQSLGCKTAYNLDGGQSAAMVIQGKFVSHPVNNGRPISDIVYIAD